MKKKALALALVLCMVLSVLPAAAFAAQTAVKTAPMELPRLAEALPGVSTQASYTVSLTGGSHGNTELLVSSPAAAGSEVYFLANPDDGYLAQIYLSGIDPDELYYIGFDIWGFYMPSNKVSLEVRYAAAQGSSHKLTLHAGKGGEAILNRSSAKADESVYLAVTPDNQNTFDPEQNVYASAGDLYYLYEDGGTHYYELFMPAEAVDIYVSFGASANPFVDVKETDYFYDAVLWAVENNITSGVDPTHFGPGQSCTRAQVVTFLWAAAGKPAPRQTVNPFTDVPAGAWFADAVLWAVENGITSGTSATTFGPSAQCTRSQVVTFLWAAAGKPAVSRANPFTDVPAGCWFEKPVLWALENGITSGTSATTFGSGSLCLRAQVVTFLYKASQLPQT